MSDYQTYKFGDSNQSGAELAKHLTEIIEVSGKMPEGLPDYLSLDEGSYWKLFQYAKDIGGKSYEKMTILHEFRGVGIVVVPDINRLYPPACMASETGGFGMPGTTFKPEKLKIVQKGENQCHNQKEYSRHLANSLSRLAVYLLQRLSYWLYILEMILSGKYHLRAKKQK